MSANFARDNRYGRYALCNEANENRWNNRYNKYDMGKQCKKRENEPDLCGSASIISFENQVPVIKLESDFC
ncbi:15988_t:CDS:2 [Gigaspora rosea]|nr:15988_t:CDS:2 [Gigaspora rosea]